MNPPDVTTLLRAVRGGEEGAALRLIEAVHAELHQMARAKMGGERVGHTLQATALVNEAFLRMRGHEGSLEDRAHFFGAAARAMERVLVDHARMKASKKRGGGAARVTISDLVETSEDCADLEVLAVHEALAALEEQSPDLASVVRYRYFVGLTFEQVAELEAVSVATLKRRWTFARAWLYERLGA